MVLVCVVAIGLFDVFDGLGEGSMGELRSRRIGHIRMVSVDLDGSE